MSQKKAKFIKIDKKLKKKFKNIEKIKKICYYKPCQARWRVSGAL